MKYVNKKKIIVILSVITFLTILLLVGAEINKRRQPGYTIEYKDKDTGEIVSTQPNKSPESFDSNEKVTVLGTSSLYTIGAAGLANNQLPLLREDLASNAIKSLTPHNPIIKVLSPAYNSESGTLEALLKYKDGIEPAKLIFTIDSLDSFTYKVIADDKVAYQSKSLLVTKDNENYTGDGAPPEEQ